MIPTSPKTFISNFMENLTLHLEYLSKTSSHLIFYKKGVLKNLTEFAGKHLRWIPFLNKVAGYGPATWLKKRL